MEPIKQKCGIVCEYNPFHNGHAYHIKKTKQALDCEIVCIMSGDFVQRAEPAMFDKRVRANAAISAGADAVIELPTVYSTAGAQQFAYGAIAAMSAVKGLNYISFGIEFDDNLDLKNMIDLITKSAKIQIDENKEFKDTLKSQLKNGKSYAAAIESATASQLDNINLSNKINIEQALKAPNNILAIEYLKAINLLRLDIKPIFIRRIDNGYNSIQLVPPFASATAIRTLIENKKDYAAFTPKDYGESPVDIKIYQALCRQAVLKSKNTDVLIKKLKKAAQSNYSLDQIIKFCKSKNNTYACIKRRIFHTLLDITSEVLDYKGKFYSKLLAIKKSFKTSLKDFDDSILISYSDEKRIYENSQNQCVSQKIYQIDKSASDLYAIITNQESDRHFKKIY